MSERQRETGIQRDRETEREGKRGKKEEGLLMYLSNTEENSAKNMQSRMLTGFSFGTFPLASLEGTSSLRSLSLEIA